MRLLLRWISRPQALPSDFSRKEALQYLKVFDTAWPEADANIAREDEIELVVQVNGKVKARLNVSRGLGESEAVEIVMASESVQRVIKDLTVRKTVFVPDRLVNLVVS